MRGIATTALRLVVSLGLVGTILYLGVFVPHDQSLVEMKKTASNVSASTVALKDAIEQFKQLPDVATIELTKKDTARQYVDLLDAAMPTFNVEPMPRPKTLSPIWREPELNEYNTIVASADFAESTSSAQSALNAAHDFMLYHRSVMYALANLLEYDPTADTQGSEEIVKGHIEAAGAGLAKTLTRLEEAPNYKDEGLTSVISRVKKVGEDGESYYQHLSGVKPDGSAKGRYIATVLEAQRAILADRQQFWQSQRALIEDVLEPALNKLQPINASLPSPNRR